jgi:hypothetical protein
MKYGLVGAFAVLLLIFTNIYSKDQVVLSNDIKTNTAPAEKKSPNKSLKNFVETYYKSKGEGGEWLAKVEDYVITKKEFDESFAFFLDQLPEGQKVLMDESAYKRQYLNELVMQYAVLAQAMQEELLADEDTVLLLRSAIRQAIYKLYISKSIPKDQSRFMPSEQEISQYYNQNKDKLTQMGLSAEQMKRYIAQQLAGQKIQLWAADFLDKTKEKHSVKRNEALLKKEGLD